MHGGKKAERERDTRWLSRDLAELALEWRLDKVDEEREAVDDVDVLIIGSGYGGAAALSVLAGCTRAGQALKIAMLERGTEYLPGMFPTRMSDLGGHVRFHLRGQDAARGRMDGLFDLRAGPDVSCLLGNGLGGGSLINAGVMEAPLADVFKDPRWPKEIRDDDTLLSQADEVQRLLEAGAFQANAQRVAVMAAIAGKSPVRAAKVTVATGDAPERGITQCNSCGDCTVGCNHGAKLSLDVTLLADACRRHPAEALRIVTGATVLSLEKRPDGGYVACTWSPGEKATE